MLTLYFSPGASSMATHIALNEVGASFELKYIPLHQKANRDTGYLGVNPEGKVPTLVVDGRPLTEVAATSVSGRPSIIRVGTLPSGLTPR